MQNTYSLDAVVGPLWHNRLGRYDFNPRGINVFDEDWDNLVILDACRQDVFQEEHDLDGRFETRQSLGSCSAQFVRGNLRGRTMHDVVIVGAVSWYEKVRTEEESFEVHDIEVVEESDDHPLKQKYVEAGRSGWIRPERVTERAREINEKYPNKRLLIQYQQPHTPYIGETGQEYFGELPFKYAWNSDGRLSVPKDVLWRAYRENLHLALDEVGELLPDLAGKTVVSSDHGELLADRRLPLYVPGFGYLRRRLGHPCGIYVKQLTEVPWFVVESDERKSIEAEVPGEQPTLNDEELERINERLRAAGYKV